MQIVADMLYKSQKLISKLQKMANLKLSPWYMHLGRSCAQHLQEPVQLLDPDSNFVQKLNDHWDSATKHLPHPWGPAVHLYLCVTWNIIMTCSSCQIILWKAKATEMQTEAEQLKFYTLNEQGHYTEVRQKFIWNTWSLWYTMKAYGVGHSNRTTTWRWPISFMSCPL